MKKVQMIEYHISADDTKRLRDLVDMAVVPHAKFLSEEDEAVAKKTKRFSDNRMVNILLNDSILTESTRKNIIDRLGEVRGHIADLWAECDREMGKVPEKSEGIIASPKQFYRVVIENYQQQRNMINEIVDILTEETEYEEN